MAAVFRELTLSWDGQDYRIKPTMALLNAIEQDVSLSTVAYRIIRNDPPLSQLATIIAKMLRHAGAKVTAEDVYAQIMSGDESSVQEMAQTLMMATFPQLGKAEAPATPKRKKPAARKTSRKSTGASTTT